ncbi:MAG: hypothetical protein NT102_07560 [Caldiserica bacterium]|nr:hypothetical protein [Caldisericota bacterium]
MELNKERGPIYSRYDRDRSDNYSAVIDFAAPPRTSEEIAFILAHKITPTEADPGDMRSGATNRYQQAETPVPAFLQLLSNSMGQRTQGQGGRLQNRNARKNQVQSKAALIGIIVWVLFILVSMLLSLRGK